MKSRFVFIFVILLGLWAVMFIKAAYLQILPNEKLAHLEKRQYRRMVTLHSRRGLILDRHQKELAVSIPSYSLYADPKLINQPRRVAQKLAKVFNRSSQSFYKKINDPTRRFVWIQRQMDRKDKEKIEALKIAGLAFVEEPKRIYPNDHLLSNVMGFVGQDGDGLEGIERRYDSQLRGPKKDFSVQKDARGRPLLVNGKLFTDNPDGSTLVLTIDAELQYRMEKELALAVSEHSADTAVGVVLDAQTNEILALANYPTFDPNMPAAYTSDGRRDRAVTDAFEPGSTMKTFLVAAALRDGLTKPNTRYFCEGGQMRIGDRIIREAEKSHNFDWLTTTEILALSSNIGAAKIAMQLGDLRLRDALVDFGFGQRTEIDLPGESRGIMQSLPWHSHLLSNVAFGHGLAATPLQMAAAYAAIANGGMLRRPYIVKSIINEETQERREFVSQDVRRVLTPEQSSLMRLMLTAATAPTATGFNARIAGYPVAGKTGTAQKVNLRDGGYMKDAYISSFAGMVPAQEPRFVIYIAVDNPKKGYYGSQVAAPVFAKVAAFAARREGLAPVLISKENLIQETKPDAQAEQRKALQNLERNMADQQSGLMPDLQGLTLREIYERIRGTDIRVHISGNGVVAKTWPSAGEPLPHNKKVKLLLSAHE